MKLKKRERERKGGTETLRNLPKFTELVNSAKSCNLKFAFASILLHYLKKKKGRVVLSRSKEEAQASDSESTGYQIWIEARGVVHHFRQGSAEGICHPCFLDRLTNLTHLCTCILKYM